ncbi:hypothetical protein [Xanthomonas sacchari]|uniref:hypothetical protein n=1 Tax=Xanthomonas sacchari TaxID=56458 RepID=UPI002256B5AD|nr:hypothetical protein [Xanthomonas sacchari]
MKDNLQSKIFLSISRALLGEVFSELVAVCCRIVGDRNFEIIFFVDTELSASKVDCLSMVETEVLADFPDFDISHVILRTGPGHVPQCDGFWIFMRKNM